MEAEGGSNGALRAIGEHLEEVGGAKTIAGEAQEGQADEQHVPLRGSERSGDRPGAGTGDISNGIGNGNGRMSSSWRKEVQHIQLQESGYQNKYIWVQQYCSECEEPAATSTSTREA